MNYIRKIFILIFLFNLLFLFNLYPDDYGMDNINTSLNGITAQISAKTVNLGKYYALLIGINNYQTQPKLKTAVKDVTDLKNVLIEKYGFHIADM